MQVLSFVSGFTVAQAINKACDRAAYERQDFLAEINDIILFIGKHSNPAALLREYKKKLDFKYEIEQLKRQRQK